MSTPADDRALLQSLIDNGSGPSRTIPNGRYVVDQGGPWWCLRIPAGVAVVGESRDGVVIAQAPVVGGVRLFQMDGAGASLADLTLDGAADTQADQDQHRAGVFAQAADVSVVNVTARGFTGDGLYFYGGTDRLLVDGCLVTGNNRNGLTLGGQTDGGRILRSQFLGNRAQQLDSEPSGPVTNLVISECHLVAATDYALTVCGHTGTDRSSDWTIQRCVVDGGIYVVWADRVRIRGCSGVNRTGHAHVTVYRSCSDVTIEDNDLRSGDVPCAHGVVEVTGTANQAPERVVIRRNRIDSGPLGVFGVFAEGPLALEVYDNDIAGPPTPPEHGVGVYVRATRPVDSVIVARNRIRSFAQYGVALYAASGVMARAVVADNVIGGGPAMAGGLYLQPGAAVLAEQSGNVVLSGVAQPLTGPWS